MKFFYLLLLLLSSCVTSTQFADNTRTTTTFDTNGVKTVVVDRMVAKSDVIATGNGQQALDKVRASSGKTASVGATGVEQTSQQSDLVKSLVELIREFKNP